MCYVATVVTSRALFLRFTDQQVSDAEEYLYDLRAVVIHHGRGFASGHYTSYCWNERGSKIVANARFNYVTIAFYRILGSLQRFNP